MFIQPIQGLNETGADSAPVSEVSISKQLDMFIRAHEQRLFKVLMVSLKDQAVALDILQEALLAFVKHYGKKSKPDDWPALLYRILQNKMRDHFRQYKVRSRWTRLTSEIYTDEHDHRLETIDPEPSVEQQLDQKKRIVQVEKLINELPERQQQVILLRAYAELSEADTAVALSMSVGSVKTHLSRARQNLRKGFAKLGLESSA